MKRVPANRYWTFAIIVCAGAACDLGTKHVIFDDLGYPGNGLHFQAGRHQHFDRDPRFEGRSRLYLAGWLKFRLFTSFNEGALWGIGQGWTSLFAIASVAAIVGILVWLFFFGAAESKWLTVCLALILAGTIGNLWDRLGLHGAANLKGETIYGVRDFFLFTFGNWNYPIFNCADMFLVTGAIMLVIQSLFMSQQLEAPAGKSAADSGEPNENGTANESGQDAPSAAAAQKPSSR